MSDSTHIISLEARPAASPDSEKEPDSLSDNLTALAVAAASDHASTPLQAIRTHRRAFVWCLFMCMGALLWGYDTQVRFHGKDGHGLNRKDAGWRWSAKCARFSQRLR